MPGMLRLKSAITASSDETGCRAALGGRMRPLVMTCEELAQVR
jgi:hypothetical protein